MTGTYYPPSSGYSGYEGGYECEPGGLSDMKVRVILDTWLGEIEQCDVEVVREDEDGGAEEHARFTLDR